ncbi:MAG: hypothetical protein WC595_05000 [Candidatus Nanoarchaeia archaeon]
MNVREVKTETRKDLAPFEVHYPISHLELSGGEKALFADAFSIEPRISATHPLTTFLKTYFRAMNIELPCLYLSPQKIEANSSKRITNLQYPDPTVHWKHTFYPQQGGEVSASAQFIYTPSDPIHGVSAPSAELMNDILAALFLGGRRPAPPAQVTPNPLASNVYFAPIDQSYTLASAVKDVLMRLVPEETYDLEIIRREAHKGTSVAAQIYQHGLEQVLEDKNLIPYTPRAA